MISNYKFTDQEHDPETGLYNYDARLYDPVVGIFISPDSIIPDIYDPQDLNRFTYVRNNPLIYVDPDGHSYGSWGNVKYGYGDNFSRGGNIDFGESSQNFSEANWNTKEDTQYYRGATQSGKYKTKQNLSVTREYYDGQLTSETDSASVLGGMDRGGAAFSLNKQALSLASKKPVTSMGKADAAQYQKLKQQLASQEQMGELAAGKGKPLIGSGTNRTLRDADRLAAEYGGNPGDWAKVSSSNKGHITGYNQETHAYMNTKTGQVVEMKTKISGH